MMCRGFVIADDFGLGRGHDAVILRLLRAGKLAGTSVMVDGDITERDLAHLRELRRDGRQIGLHLNLTHGFGGMQKPSIGALLKMAFTGRLPDTIAPDLMRQSERFADLFGDAPDFYDGHQHCHCLPGIARHVRDLPRSSTTWIRVPLPSGRGLWRNTASGGTKTVVIATMAWAARRIWCRAGWQVNDSFSGFLKLHSADMVARDLPQILATAQDGDLIMTHPGDPRDPDQCPDHAPQARAIEAQLLDRTDFTNGAALRLRRTP